MRFPMVARVALAVVVAVFVGTSADAAGGQKKGRYKKEGDKCVWVNESGPDQCEPPKGRFKKDGDDCVWDANDGGNDQCSPKKGRSSSHHPTVAAASWGNRRLARPTYASR